MKWLLNTFWGRLYLVTQVTCLGITIYFCVKFMGNDRASENRALNYIWTVHTLKISELPEGKREEANIQDSSEIQQSMEAIQQEHSETRLRASFYYLVPNLAVVALWTVGYFVAKGLPARKPEAG